MKAGKKQRLDQRLIELGLAEHPAKALALIMAGQVLVDEQLASKAGQLVRNDAVIRLKGQRRFVSRGGEKLWGAIHDFEILEKLEHAVVLDIGSSTGGFTDCCLQLGALKVFAVDIGTNQLDWKLRQDPRVQVFEQTDVRHLPAPLDMDINFIVADISFNSLERLLPDIIRAAPAQNVHFLLLVKPQFELSAEEVPAGGVVDSPKLQEQAMAKVKQRMELLGLEFLGFRKARLKGRSGNQEFFVLAKNS
ncbi:MAG: TlyA family RNA methyltransferase [Oligoflexus sp.]